MKRFRILLGFGAGFGVILALQTLQAGASKAQRPPRSPSSIPALKIPGETPIEPTALQKLTIQQLTTIFENGTTRFQYSYIEDIGDGAGATCGMVGFTGDELLLIASRYVAAKGASTPLASYLPCLRKMGDAIEQDYSCLFPDVPKSVMATEAFKQEGGGISRSDFGAAWVGAGSDPVMRKIQRDYVDAVYYDPAMRAADRLRIDSPLGRAMIYDTIVQMPSLLEIESFAQGRFAKKHAGRVYPANDAEEIEWLTYFQQKRHELLSQSTGNSFTPRIDSLNQILATGNLELNLPFRITYFGSSFTLDGTLDGENSKDQ